MAFICLVFSLRLAWYTDSCSATSGPGCCGKRPGNTKKVLRARMVQYSSFLRSRLLLVCVNNKRFIYLLVLLIVSSSERCRILNRNKSGFPHSRE